LIDWWSSAAEFSLTDPPNCQSPNLSVCQITDLQVPESPNLPAIQPSNLPMDLPLSPGCVKILVQKNNTRLGVLESFGGRLMVGQGTLDPSVEVRVLAPELLIRRA
jgi:hypothetical protein